MKLTRQQGLVLFDIAKSAMNHSEIGFAGYSKEEIMKLVNQIISQQDNNELIELEDDIDIPKTADVDFVRDDIPKTVVIKPCELHNVGKVEDPEIVVLKHDEGLQDVTVVFKDINKNSDNFWD